MYQYRLVNCNKCTGVMQDDNKRGNCERQGEETYGNSVPWTQFFRKPQSSLKNSLFKKQKKITYADCISH